MLIASVFLLLMSSGVSSAEETASHSAPRLIATLEPQSAVLGETAQLIITYTLPDGASLPKTLEIGGLEGLTVVKRETVPGKIMISLLVDRLETWKTGTLALTYLDKDGNILEMTAPGVSLSVTSNVGEKEDKLQLRPIRGIMPTRLPWNTYAPWLAGFLILAFLGLGVIWWRRKRRVDEIRAEVLEPPQVRAKRQLEKLLDEGLFEAGDIKTFYFSFSEILREYLGDIRGFGAKELTTEEIAGHLHSTLDRTVVDLLRQADLVKFADSVPTAGKKDGQIMTAFTYIEKTSQAQIISEPSMVLEGENV
jgi:hypothetical protein